MIYLKNNTEIQTIYIPRQTVLGGGYIATTKTYEDGLAEGIERGKEIQKGQLLNLYVTENGEYEREDGWGAITVNIPREECPEGGSCNLGIGEYGFDSNTVGDYELYASDDGYDGWSKMFIHIYGDSGAIRVWRASDLLDSFNNDNGAGLDYGWNYYVGGIITEKQEFNTEYDYATYILDNGFKIYRGKWLNGDSFLGEDPIKLGAYAIVYGVLQDNNGELGLEEGSQVVAYQECGGGSCNLEDKSVTPSMSDRDNNGLIVVNPSEGYDGLSRTVINPQTLYNEGVEAGRAEGGEGGSCNLGETEFEFGISDFNDIFELSSSDEGYDGWSKVTIKFFRGDWATIYNAGKVFELYNTFPAIVHIGLWF